MTIRERIEAVLRGERPDRIPFTIYWLMLPSGEQERLLRERGLGIVWRTNVLRWEYPRCDMQTVSFTQDGRDLQRVTWRTPVGEVYSTTTTEPEYGTSAWTLDYFLKKPEDYRVLRFIADDARPVAAYENFHRLDKQLGADGYVLAQLGYSPLMEMMIQLIGIEQAAYEMFDHEDEFWTLYESLCQKMRRAYPVAAASPAPLTLYCGNVHPQIVSPERFEKYIVSCYHEFADHLHERGKLLGVHLDANTRLYKDIVARSKIDVIEAFTPPPDCDLPLREARTAWPDKILWINFPSSVHLATEQVIRQTTRQLLSEAAPDDRFLIGVTEDIPPDCWPKSLGAIAETINEHGRAS